MRESVALILQQAGCGDAYYNMYEVCGYEGMTGVRGSH